MVAVNTNELDRNNFVDISLLCKIVLNILKYQNMSYASCLGYL